LICDWFIAVIDGNNYIEDENRGFGSRRKEFKKGKNFVFVNGRGKDFDG